jgi:branched-chain amino acid transport system substrate-binding protein
MNRQVAPACFLLVLLSLFLPGAAPAGDIVLGMSAAFKGPSRGLSIELYRGSLAYLAEVNRTGGVHGNTIHIKAYDDGYNPKDAIDNTIQLVEKDKVFLLFDYMGTPTVTRILPLLKKYEDHSLFLFFPFTGAEPQRRYPYDAFVFNLRASYHQETATLVDHLVAIGRKRIAVFYQIDAYGRNGWDGVRRQLRKYGVDIVAEATYPRGTPYSADLGSQVALLRRANPDAIISIATYAAGAAFIRDARDAGWTDIPIANISGVDSDNMLTKLLESGKAAGKDYTGNLINSQVVPSYDDLALPAVREYRKLMDRHRPMPPRELLDQDYHGPAHSFIGLEGFLNARLLVEILRRLGPEPKREHIRKVVESIQDLDLGIDARVLFGPEQHQGLRAVYCTRIEGGHFVPVADEDWQRWHP